jgi:hypothetical protein
VKSFVGRSLMGQTNPGSDYTEAEWEFIRAVEKYQRRFRRRYPTWREILHVARCLGYRKIAKPSDLAKPALDDLPEPSEQVLEQLRKDEANESSNPELRPTS